MSARLSQWKKRCFEVCRGWPAWLIAAAMAGCIPVPLPIRSIEIGPVPEKVVAQVRSGTSTRADVLLLLGDPFVRGPQDAYFVYTWAFSRGGVMVIGLTGGGPMPGPQRQEYTCRALAVRFAATGQVDRAAIFEGAVRSVSSLMDLDQSTSLPGLCRRDRDLIARIEAWVAEPVTTDDVPPRGSSVHP